MRFNIARLIQFLCVAMLLGCESADAPRSGAKRFNGENEVREHFEGFSFELPEQWTRVMPDHSKTRAMLLLGAQRWDLADAMIKVDVGKPAANDRKALARQFANQIGGTVDQEPVTVDGETGVRVTSMKAEPSLAQPAEVVIVFRNGRAFLIMGSAKKTGAIAEPIEKLIRSWQWEK